MKKQIYLAVDEETHIWLKEWAKNYGYNVSEFIGQLISAIKRQWDEEAAYLNKTGRLPHKQCRKS